MFQGVGSDNVPWHFTTANQDFSLCETYPKVLAVPSSCSDEEIRSVAAFRSKGRLPVSVWLGEGQVTAGEGVVFFFHAWHSIYALINWGPGIGLGWTQV